MLPSLYQLKGMRAPAEDFPVGTVGWVTGMSARFQQLVSVLQVREQNAPRICDNGTELLGKASHAGPGIIEGSRKESSTQRAPNVRLPPRT